MIKGKIHTRYQKVIHFLVLLAIGFSIINNAIYIHTHKLADGSIVVHAHPFNKATSSENLPVQTHKHTQHEYVFLDHILVLVPFLLAFYAILLISRKQKQFVHELQHIQKIRINHFYLRGPPAIQKF